MDADVTERAEVPNPGGRTAPSREADAAGKPGAVMSRRSELQKPVEPSLWAGPSEPLVDADYCSKIGTRRGCAGLGPRSG